VKTFLNLDFYSTASRMMVCCGELENNSATTVSVRNSPAGLKLSVLEYFSAIKTDVISLVPLSGLPISLRFVYK